MPRHKNSRINEEKKSTLTLSSDEINYVNSILQMPYLSSDYEIKIAKKEYTSKNHDFKYYKTSVDNHVKISGERIERPSHGIAHTLRVCKFVPEVIQLLKKAQYPGIESINQRDIERMALFSVSGRYNECGFRDNSETYRFFRWRSAQLFKKYYAKTYNPNKLETLANIVEDMGNPQNTTIEHIILNIAHKLDLSRVYSSYQYNENCRGYIEQVLPQHCVNDIDNLCQNSKRITNETDWRSNRQNFLFVTKNPALFYFENIKSVKERKNRLIKKIKNKLKLISNQEDIYKLFNSVFDAKKNNNQYHILWNKHDLFGTYKNQYGDTKTGNLALDLIKSALLEKIKRDGKISDFFSLEKIKKIFPEGNQDVFPLNSHYFPNESGCDIISLSSNTVTTELRFEDIKRFIENRNAVILLNKNLFYVNQQKETVELIEVNDRNRKNYNKLINKLKSNFSGYKTAEGKELKLINSITGYHHGEEYPPVQGPMYLNPENDQNYKYNDFYPIKNKEEIHVYRGDSRSPSQIIAQEGFHPRKLQHLGIKNHVKETSSQELSEKYRSGGISTSRSESVAKEFGKYCYRIKLNPYQGTDVNATFNDKKEFFRQEFKGEKEILITSSISLEQIEVQINGNWHSLQDIKDKKINPSNVVDTNKNTLEAATDILTEHSLNNHIKYLKYDYDFRKIILEIKKKAPNLINKNNFNKIRKNNKLKNAILALSSSNITLTYEQWEKLFENKKFQIAVSALSRTNQLNETTFSWLSSSNEQVTNSIITLWNIDPTLITEENINKVKTQPFLTKILLEIASSHPKVIKHLLKLIKNESHAKSITALLLASDDIKLYASLDMIKKVENNPELNRVLSACYRYIQNDKKGFFHGDHGINATKTLIKELISRKNENLTHKNIQSEVVKYLQGKGQYRKKLFFGGSSGYHKRSRTSYMYDTGIFNKTGILGQNKASLFGFFSRKNKSASFSELSKDDRIKISKEIKSGSFMHL